MKKDMSLISRLNAEFAAVESKHKVIAQKEIIKDLLGDFFKQKFIRRVNIS